MQTDLRTRINETATALKKRYPDRNLLNLPNDTQVNDTQVNDFVTDVLAYTEHFIFNKLRSKNPGVRQRAEDIAQISTTDALRHFDGFNQSGDFTAWLHTICTTRMISYLTRRKQLVNLGEDTPMDGARWTSVSTRPIEPIEEAIEAIREGDRQKIHQEIHQAVQRLAPQYQAVIEKFYLNGMSGADAASSEGIPEGTLRRRLHTARGYLREALSPSKEEQNLTR